MSSLVEWFNLFVSKIIWFFNSIITVINYVFSILRTLWYWLTSLLSWIWSLIVDVFNWTVFDLISDWFIQLSLYIWVPWIVFISSLFLIVLLRVVISFIFKFFRLNIDYKVKK